MVFGITGTAVNTAIEKYLNQKQVPQLFVIAGASRSPTRSAQKLPGTMAAADLAKISQIYAKALSLEKKPDAKIAVFFQNDDSGKDYYNGLAGKAGDKRRMMIVAEESFEITEPTIDTHIVKLKASGADTFFSCVPKFVAQAIKKVGRARLEADVLPVRNVGDDRRRDQLRRLRAPSPRCDRLSAAFCMKIRPIQPGDDPGMKQFDEFLGAYMPEAGFQRCLHHVRQHRADHGRGAEELRR